MDARFIGIDVSKDKLDVHIRPGAETFVVSRDADGLDELIKQLKPVRAVAIGVEATGGFEQVVAATVAGARGAGLAIVTSASRGGSDPRHDQPPVPISILSGAPCRFGGKPTSV